MPLRSIIGMWKTSSAIRCSSIATQAIPGGSVEAPRDRLPTMTETETEAPATAAVLTERRGNVLLITINRPEMRNAVNAAVAAGIGNALDELDSDDELAV